MATMKRVVKWLGERAGKPRKIARKKLAELMSPWGSDFSYGKGSGAVGAVASFYYDGHPYPDRQIVEDALAEVQKDEPLARAGEHDWTADDAQDLRTIARGLLYYLGKDYGREGAAVAKRAAKKAKGVTGKLASRRGKSLAPQAAPGRFVQQYKETALWSSNDESDEQGGEPLDKNYSVSDIAPETEREMRADCDRFYAENRADLEVLDDDSEAGHDFWLTRNGHGAGFSDLEYDHPEIADTIQRLDKAAEGFGEVYLHVSDGKIYS